MATRVITGTILHADSTPWVGATVTFEMEAGTFTIAPDVTYVRDGERAVTDSAGEFTVTLTSGLSVYWRCSLPDGDGFRFALADGGAVTLEALRASSEGLPIPITTGAEILITDGAQGDMLVHNGTQFVNRPNAVFNVLDYGATGDGVTDDTDAIEAAIAAAGVADGGTVFFPVGTYRTGSRLTVSAPNITLSGHAGSSIIKPLDGAELTGILLIQSPADFCTVQSLVFDGNRANDGLTPTGGGAGGLTTWDVSHVTVKDVEARECSWSGIHFWQDTDIALCDNVYCHDNGLVGDYWGNGIQLFECTNIYVANSRLEDNHGTVCNPVGGECGGAGIAGEGTNVHLANTILKNNYNIGGMAVDSGIAGIVQNWTFDHCQFIITDDQAITAGLELGGLDYTVTGCTFDGITNTAIAFVTRAAPGGQATIAGNLFKNCNYCIDHADTGGSLDVVANVVITGNVFQDSTLGVGMRANAENWVIANNDFSNTVTTPIDDDGCENLVAFGNLPGTANKVLKTGLASAATALDLATNNNILEARIVRNSVSGLDSCVHIGAGAGGSGQVRLYANNTNHVTVDTTSCNIEGYFSVADGVTAPSASGSRAFIYVDTADGDLKVKFGDGTVKTLATDT